MPTPTTDFSIFDHREAVTYMPASDPQVENVMAVRRPLTQSRQRNVERYVELEVTDVVLHLDGTPLNGLVLMAGDVMVDSNGLAYTVVFVERQTLNDTVVVICRSSGA